MHFCQATERRTSKLWIYESLNIQISKPDMLCSPKVWATRLWINTAQLERQSIAIISSSVVKICNKHQKRSTLLPRPLDLQQLLTFLDHYFGPAERMSSGFNHLLLILCVSHRETVTVSPEKIPMNDAFEINDEWCRLTALNLGPRSPTVHARVCARVNHLD